MKKNKAKECCNNSKHLNYRKVLVTVPSICLYILMSHTENIIKRKESRLNVIMIF